MKLSVVIPVYNEAATIKQLIGRVQAVDIPKEIIVVDDGSTDGTRDVLARLDGHDNIRVFLQPRNPHGVNQREKNVKFRLMVIPLLKQDG